MNAKTKTRFIGLALAGAVAFLLGGLGACDRGGDHDDHDHAGQHGDDQHSDDQHSDDQHGDSHADPGDKAGNEHEGHAEHGGDVVLTEKQLANSDIRSERVGPARISHVLELTATVGENLDAEAHVNPRVPGIVKIVHRKLGDRVEAGDPLCEIDSVDLGNAVAAYLEAQALLGMGRAVLKAETALLERGVEVARRIFDREKKLADKQISTLRPYYEADRALSEAELQKERRLLELGTELKRREIQLRAAHARLETLGLPNDKIEILSKPRQPGEPEPPELHGHYTIVAPRAGVIVRRDITVSEFVDEETELFKIHDLEWVWVFASVYEKDLASVRTGQRARLRLNAFPGTALEGEVTLVAYEVDPDSRAVPIRIELLNTELEAWPEKDPIRPGMFGAVELIISERDVAVAIPEAALVHEGEETFVFVREDEHTFERREVHVREGADGVCEVLSGVEAGEDVVIEGTFVLKSVARSEELGGGHSH